MKLHFSPNGIRNMYYHLNDHVYVTQFRDELILLDTQKDKYTVCFKVITDLMNKFLEETHFEEELPLQEEQYINLLLKNNVIERKITPYPFQIDRKPNSTGVSNVDWRLPLGNAKISLNSQVFGALITLIKVNLYIRYKGLYATIQLIKKFRKEELIYTLPQNEELKALANVVNKACLMYPSRTKCLEWAITFVLLALKRKWKCNLEIGVQNYPFFAHAWVECDGKVVMDSQDLRSGLAIILNEPFRRKK